MLDGDKNQGRRSTQAFRTGDLLARTLAICLGRARQVELEDVVSPEARIIEIDADSTAVGELLLGAGRARYLRLARQTDASEVPTVPYHGRQQIRENNAQILILSGASQRHGLRFALYRHAERVLVPVQSGPALAASLLGLAANRLLGRMRAIRYATAVLRDGRPMMWLVGEVRKPKPPEARRYLSPFRGIGAFVDELNDRQTSYAVLRWFEALPEIARGEDVDFLVADDDIDDVHAMLDREPGTIPLDVYSVSGLPGSQYRGMAYYPPHLARRILAGRALYNGRFAGPSPRDHFLSLSYHAVYQKGAASGLPGEKDEECVEGVTSRADHDYGGTLRRLAGDLSLDADVSLDGLDRYLASRGWRPALETLRQLAKKNSWLGERVKLVATEVSELVPGNERSSTADAPTSPIASNPG
jgi:hypothetical protein